jgi:hypothetical protein
VIQHPSSGSVPTEVGKDFTEVLRPLCDIETKPIEEELEHPEEEQSGVRNPRKMLDPKLPSQREIEEHCLTHLPYRN